MNAVRRVLVLVGFLNIFSAQHREFSGGFNDVKIS